MSVATRAALTRLEEIDMPTAVESPIDFRQLKATLAASDRENPVNCVVASFSDRSLRFAVDRRRPGKVLARDLEGAKPARYFYGTAYYDTFPGTIFLTLDRSPRWLAGRLRVALRGSGFGNVDIVIADGADEEEY
ncbi:MAG TPA: hypothetical protein VN814_14550 [Caulobacteraceae bacterium]|nr:hypothetical protein [Caulobacteraceae bacterium]